jgi:hypothetical protein
MAISARIHVLFAPKAKVGVVIRRGPSKTVCTMLWDRRTDEFTLGQWLRGRIYERRCDLSPDGKHFMYFAMNGIWESAVGGSWTAISLVPYLKAVTLYPKGDCWYGGGLFLDNRTYWLNGASGHRQPTKLGKLKADPLYTPTPSYGGECLGVYYHRLQRDGWRYVEHVDVDDDSAFDLFEKELWWGWTLRKFAHASLKHGIGQGVYHDGHELSRDATSEQFKFHKWEWADYDGHRILWATEGKIFAADLRKNGLGDARELYDFNNMRFSAIKAPY